MRLCIVVLKVWIICHRCVPSSVLCSLSDQGEFYTIDQSGSRINSYDSGDFCYCNCRSGSRIVQWGTNTKVGAQPISRPHFPNNCMNMKEIWLGGGRASVQNFTLHWILIHGLMRCTSCENLLFNTVWFFKLRFRKCFDDTVWFLLLQTLHETLLLIGPQMSFFFTIEIRSFLDTGLFDYEI